MVGRILVLNNEPFLLELMEQILKSEGYERVVGMMAPYNLSEILAVNPDLLILDVVAGQEVAAARFVQSLKFRLAGKPISLIVFMARTAQGRAMQVALGKEVYVLPRSFSIAAFLHTVREALDDRDVQRAEWRSSASGP
ncbi:MAG: hypothetical protein M3220_12045 [Chloroflexota bacterium]|nr:hypothetical protein [Chloroflexota bacterium]